jgi:hypothetical protein
MSHIGKAIRFFITSPPLRCYIFCKEIITFHIVRVLHAVKACTDFRLLLMCVYGISPSIKSSMFLGPSIRSSFYIDAFVGLDTCFFTFTDRPPLPPYHFRWSFIQGFFLMQPQKRIQLLVIANIRKAAPNI